MKSLPILLFLQINHDIIVNPIWLIWHKHTVIQKIEKIIFVK